MAVSLEGTQAKEELATQIRIDSFSRVWRSSKEGEKLASPDLEIGGATFQVRLGRVVHTEAEKNVSLYLYRVDSGVNPVRTSMEVSFKRSASASCTAAFAKYYWFVAAWAKSQSDHHVHARGWQKLCAESELLTHVELNGDDTARLDVKISTVCPGGVLPPDHSCCLKRATDSLVPLLLMRNVGDLVTISAAGGFQLRVPRPLLCAHSGVLRAALDSVMIEGISGVLRMPDVQQRTLEDFIHCLYSGGLPGSIVSAGVARILDVLVLADKYGVSALADACVWSLSVAASEQNAPELLKLSEQHGLTRLYRVLVNFTKGDFRRAKAVMDSDEYTLLTADTVRELTAHWLGSHQLVSQAACAALSTPAIPGGSVVSSSSSGAGAEIRGLVVGKKDATKEKDADASIPAFLQWGDAEREFADDTDWTSLHANQLRRACLERCLASAGTSSQLAARLLGPAALELAEQDVISEEDVALALNADAAAASEAENGFKRRRLGSSVSLGSNASA